MGISVCKICKEKVLKWKCSGFMEVCKQLYHFECVKEYGYQKFCSEIIEYKKSINEP
jgi:hypothetical protein